MVDSMNRVWYANMRRDIYCESDLEDELKTQHRIQEIQELLQGDLTRHIKTILGSVTYHGIGWGGEFGENIELKMKKFNKLNVKGMEIFRSPSAWIKP